MSLTPQTRRSAAEKNVVAVQWSWDTSDSNRRNQRARDRGRFDDTRAMGWSQMAALAAVRRRLASRAVPPP